MDCRNGLVDVYCSHWHRLCVCVCLRLGHAANICGAPPYIGTERNGGGLRFLSCLVLSCYYCTPTRRVAFRPAYRLPSCYLLPATCYLLPVYRLTSVDPRPTVLPPSLSEQGELLPRNISDRPSLKEPALTCWPETLQSLHTRAGSHFELVDANGVHTQ